MEFRILGPLEAYDAGRPVALGGSKQRGVLAILLTRAGEVVSRDRLIDDLWAGDPPPSAVSILQTYVSHLRKALGRDVVVTRASGYAVDLAGHELDLVRFERLLDEARGQPPAVAAALLREALGLWRGPALADFRYEPFAQAEIARLEELRVAALERRIEAELELGRHAELVGDIEGLVRAHPLRERPRALLMRALYGAGRQAEALAVYQDARRVLVDQLGIEPSLELQELERAILRHDVRLAGRDGPLEAPEPEGSGQEAAAEPAPERAILVVAGEGSDALVRLGVALARHPPRELIVARLVDSPGELETAASSLQEKRAAVEREGVRCRVAAFTSGEQGRDVVLLASEQPADLVLCDAPEELLGTGTIPDELGVVLADAPCHVGLLVTRRPGTDGGPVVAPFTGAEHDWAAIEIGAWLARSLDRPLRLVGTAADPASGRRDASRLLARASLMIQRTIGIATEPRLVEPGERTLVEAADDAELLVVGLSPRWRDEGLGNVRLAAARSARPPTLLVRRGLRPSGLAPRESVTRFTWTLGATDP